MGWKRFFEGIIVFLSSISLTFCISTYFGIDVSVRRSVLIIAILCLWFMAACINNKMMAVMVPLGIVIWGLHTYTNWEEIISEKDILYVIFPAVMVISIGVYKYKSSIVHIMITIVLASVFLLTDSYPYEPVFFLWFASALAGRCLKREGGNIASAVILVLVFSVLMISQKYVSTPVALLIRSHSSDVRYFQQKINMKLAGVFKFINGKTDINGELDNSNPGNNKNTDIIVYVEVKPQDNIYLKGFVGDEYVGDGWTEISDDKFYEEFSDWNVTDTNYELTKMQLINEYYYRYYYNNKTNDVLQMKVELAGYSGKYVLYPYGVNLDTSYEYFADGEILNKGENIYNYSYRPVMKYDQYDYHYSDAADNYREYVYSEYLSTGKNLINLERVCRELDNSSFINAKNSIRNYLVTKCRYGTELEPVPYGLDFTEYFVFSQKEGYCTHFATASTLMFRIMGYPARYVTGYVVFPGDFVKNDDRGYTAVVTGDNAHAWTEVYFDGVWYPIETTPGYISTAPEYFGNSFNHGNSIEEETEEISEENHTEEESAAGVKGEELTKPQGNKVSFETIGILDMFGFMFRVIMYAFIIAAFIIIRRALIVCGRRMYFRKSNPGKSVKAITRYTFKMLGRAGYVRKSGMSDSEYEKSIGLESFEMLMKTALEAEFSNHDITAEDIRYCILMNKKIENKLYGQMGKFHRFVWKYIYCYK